MEGLEEVGESALPWSLARSCPPGSQPNLPHMMQQNGNTMVSLVFSLLLGTSQCVECGQAGSVHLFEGLVPSSPRWQQPLCICSARPTIPPTTIIIHYL